MLWARFKMLKVEYLNKASYVDASFQTHFGMLYGIGWGKVKVTVIKKIAKQFSFLFLKNKWRYCNETLYVNTFYSDLSVMAYTVFKVRAKVMYSKYKK